MIDNKARAILLTTSPDNDKLDSDFSVAVSTAMLKFHWIHWFHFCANGKVGKNVPELDSAQTTFMGKTFRDKDDDDEFLETLVKFGRK